MSKSPIKAVNARYFEAIKPHLLAANQSQHPFHREFFEADGADRKTEIALALLQASANAAACLIFSRIATLTQGMPPKARQDFSTEAIRRFLECMSMLEQQMQTGELASNPDVHFTSSEPFDFRDHIKGPAT